MNLKSAAPYRLGTRFFFSINMIQHPTRITQPSADYATTYTSPITMLIRLVHVPLEHWGFKQGLGVS